MYEAVAVGFLGFSLTLYLALRRLRLHLALMASLSTMLSLAVFYEAVASIREFYGSFTYYLFLTLLVSNIAYTCIFLLRRRLQYLYPTMAPWVYLLVLYALSKALGLGVFML
jgi:hypothetical protein